MKTIIVHIAVMGALAFVPSGVSQERDSATSRPSPKEQKPVSFAKVMKDLEKEVDGLRAKCEPCKGTGKVECPISPGANPATKIEKCRYCRGEGRVLRASGLVEAYLIYCDFETTHAEQLAEKKNKKHAHKVAEQKAGLLGRIRDGIGTEKTFANQTWRVGEDGRTRLTPPPLIPTGEVNKPQTAAACGLILSKTSPVGRGIAFSGEVLGTSSAGDSTLALVAVENTRTEDPHCYVIVPTGARWVRGAKVRVIGRIVEPQPYKAALLENDPGAVVVKTAEGTE